MEGEIDRSQLKHVCKLCNKRYPSGKSLGGHMRSHVIANKAFLKNKAPSFHPPTHFHYDDDDQNGDDQNGGSGPHSGYGLRENPKKTWRASNHNLNSYQKQEGQQQQQEIRVCKQCGKAFQSVKALCGHMSSHSERERNFKYVDDDDDDDEDDDHSWSSDTHSPDHTNIIISSSKRQTRSSYSRYTLSNNNSDIDQHQQEEVAICLMMLSRDHHHSSNSSPHDSKSFNFGPESSDNNSVIMEGGSSSNHVGGIIVGKTKDFNFMNTNKFKEVGMSQKVNVCQEMDNSDSGYFENGAKELESDDSVDGFFVRNYYYYSKNPSYNQFGSDGGSKKRVLSFESPESEGNYSSKKINTSNSQKKVSKFECGKCHQTFKTYQALGGHIISSHRKNGTHENTLEEPNFAKKGAAKKAKGHKCPYCPKVFKSGQALGGHKRSHMMGGARRGAGGPPPPDPVPEASPTPTPPPHPMIDLNLPAPLDEEEEEEACGNSEFVAW